MNAVSERHSKAAMTSDPQAQTEQSAPASTPAPTTTETAPQQPLSKNAQKRIARAARIAEQKKERRAYEKEKKKEKKRELAAKRAAGELDEEQEGPRKKARLEGPRTPFGARIVVDLGFDDMMTENVSVLAQWRSRRDTDCMLFLIGSQIFDKPTCIHIQRKQESIQPVLLSVIHLIKWPHIHSS